MSPQSKRRSGLGLQSDSASNSTPSKLLLMRGERQMNILSPEEGTSLHQVATQRVVIHTSAMTADRPNW